MATSNFKRAIFFANVRVSPFGGHLSQGQVNGMNAILAAWEEDRPDGDVRHLAYMLGTGFHETARTMKPIEEIGRGQGRPYGRIDPVTGKAHFGRGLVQITWRENYDKMGQIVMSDLVRRPELALDPDIAISIMFEGMERGSFSGHKLSDYFNASTEDPINARRIINGTDRAQLVAGYYQAFLKALRAAQKSADARPPSPAPLPPPIPKKPTPDAPRPAPQAGFFMSALKGFLAAFSRKG